MLVEILITAALVGAAGYILIKKVKDKAAGKCDCGCCSSHCAMYKEDAKNKNK